MSKAVLVMDTPGCCADCPCSLFERDNPKLNLICGYSGEDINNVSKPDWCPLRPMPEKRKANSIPVSPLLEETFSEYNKGWNACVDALLSDSENEKEVREPDGIELEVSIFYELLNVAIRALEEIRQYREIGTLEECRAAVEKLRKINEVVKEWDKVGYTYSNNHMCEIKMIMNKDWSDKE